jgi:hypothetical protein
MPATAIIVKLPTGNDFACRLKIMAGCVIFQGYLQKTPPLDKLIVTWKKRWFILSQKDPFDPRSVQLTYFTDSNLAEKRGTIDMPNITRIHPSPSKAKGHIFSIEIKDKKIMLKADDAKTKDIWIAKLYEFAGHGHNYHVSVPNQPLASYNEGLLQLGRSESGVSIIPPTSSTSILEIPYSKIRRFGYQVRMVFWQMHRGLGDPPFVAAKSSETIKLLASC